MKKYPILLALSALALAACSTPAASSSDPSPSSSDPSPSSSDPSSSSAEPSSSSSSEIPAEIEDIASLGKLLYKGTAKASNAYTYKENGAESRYIFTTREMLISRGEDSFSYEGLIGGYYREINTGSSASATKVNEASQAESTAYWQDWINSKLSWNSLSNHADNTHFGVNGVTRPFGKYDAETDTLTGVSTPKTYRVGAVSTGYRIYIESYLETSNTELSLWYNYEITSDIYLDDELNLMSISTTYDRASDSSWDKETHSISGSTSFLTMSYAVSDISWGEIPSYDDENPLVDFAPYYMTSLSDIDIVDTEAGWHGHEGRARQGDYYSMPNDADKMSFLPESALDYAEVDITSVSPAGAVQVGVGYGQFIYSGEIEITFGTPANPSLLTKTYTVEADADFDLTPPVINSFEGNLEAVASSENTYTSSIAVGGSAYYTAITGLGTSVSLDLRQLACSYDEEVISLSYESSSNLEGKTILFTATGLKAGTTTLTIIAPSSTSEGAATKTHTINITVA